MNSLAKLAPRKLREDVSVFIEGDLIGLEAKIKRCGGVCNGPRDFKPRDLCTIRQNARAEFRPLIKAGKYGSLSFVLGIVLEAVIRWAIRRFLEWRFPQGKK